MERKRISVSSKSNDLDSSNKNSTEIPSFSSASDKREGFETLDFRASSSKTYISSTSSSRKDGSSKARTDIRDTHRKFMIAFKVQKCKEKVPHDKRLCMFYHSKADRRRNPFEIPYASQECPNSSDTKDCEDGDNCLKAHNMLERMFHPELYKISKCQSSNGGPCERGNFCAFAHSDEDQRVPELRPPSIATSTTLNSVELSRRSTLESEKLNDELQDRLVKLIKSTGKTGIRSPELPKVYYNTYSEKLAYDDPIDKQKIKDLLLMHPNVVINVQQGIPIYLYEDSIAQPAQQPSSSTSTNSGKTTVTYSVTADISKSVSEYRDVAASGIPAPSTSPFLDDTGGIGVRNSFDFTSSIVPQPASYDPMSLGAAPLSPLTILDSSPMASNGGGLGVNGATSRVIERRPRPRGPATSPFLLSDLSLEDIPGLDNRKSGRSFLSFLRSPSTDTVSTSTMFSAPISSTQSQNGLIGAGDSNGIHPSDISVHPFVIGRNPTVSTPLDSSPHSYLSQTFLTGTTVVTPNPIAVNNHTNAIVPASSNGIPDRLVTDGAGLIAPSVTPSASGRRRGPGPIPNVSLEEHVAPQSLNGKPPVKPTRAPSLADKVVGSTPSVPRSQNKADTSRIYHANTSSNGASMTGPDPNPLLMSAQLEQLTKQVEYLNVVLSQKNKDHETTMKELEDAKRSKSQTEDSYTNLLRENSNLQNMIERLKESEASHVSTIQGKQREINSLRESLKEKESTLSKAEATKSSLVPELKQLRQKISVMERDHENSKRENDHKIDMLVMELATARNELEEARKVIDVERDVHNSQMEEMRESLGQSENRTRQLSLFLRKSRDALSDSESQQKEIRAELNRLKEVLRRAMEMDTTADTILVSDRDGIVVTMNEDSSDGIDTIEISARLNGSDNTTKINSNVKINQKNDPRKTANKTDRSKKDDAGDKGHPHRNSEGLDSAIRSAKKEASVGAQAAAASKTGGTREQRDFEEGVAYEKSRRNNVRRTEDGSSIEVRGSGGRDEVRDGEKDNLKLSHSKATSSNRDVNVNDSKDKHQSSKGNSSDNGSENHANDRNKRSADQAAAPVEASSNIEPYYDKKDLIYNYLHKTPGPSTYNRCSLPGCVLSGMFRCSACNEKDYCGVIHQREHWKIHKKECKKIRQTRKEPTS